MERISAAGVVTATNSAGNQFDSVGLSEAVRKRKERGGSTQVRLKSALGEFKSLQIPWCGSKMCSIQLYSQQALPTALTAPTWLVAAAQWQIHRQT